MKPKDSSLGRSIQLINLIRNKRKKIQVTNVRNDISNIAIDSIDIKIIIMEYYE